MPNSVSSAPRDPAGARALGSARRITLHDYWTALHDGKWFSQAFDTRSERDGGAEIEEDHMIFGMVDRLFERKVQLHRVEPLPLRADAKFAVDSPLEGDGFELPVPREIGSVSPLGEE